MHIGFFLLGEGGRGFGEGGGEDLTDDLLCIATYMCIYRKAGNFHGVLIFVIFVVDLAVTKFSTHEN